jgi:hypothetical protein
MAGRLQQHVSTEARERDLDAAPEAEREDEATSTPQGPSVAGGLCRLDSPTQVPKKEDQA